MVQWRLVLVVACIAGLPMHDLTHAQSMPPPGPVPLPVFDVLIVNGHVIDGSGNPWLREDLGIVEDRIVERGRLGGRDANRVIDAKGLVVAPGFIDVHSHAVAALRRPELRTATALLSQGVTTIVGNPDGGGPIDLGAQRESLEQAGIGVNVGLMIGHGSVRRAVLGNAIREPDASEVARMEAIVTQAVGDGAFGLSSGLFYEPGRYAKLEEVIALARVAGGVYESHIRDEGNYGSGLVASVDEVIRVAEEAQVRGIVTHVKALGPDSWGLSQAIVDNIDRARARGVEVFADQYPYEASSTSLGAAVLPGPSTPDAIRPRLAEPPSADQLLKEVTENIRRRGGPASIVIASGRGAPGQAGRNLAQIAAATGVSPAMAAINILLEGGASIVSFNMSDGDIATLMRQPWTMTSSDGDLSVPGPARPHPRGHGAFARKLAVYVRERGVQTLEDAIRAMTSLSARVFGLNGRGELRVGSIADVVVFDPATIQDRATYEDPFAFATGVQHVLVNGQVAILDGEPTGALAGRVLRR
ncbi:MAG: amidohydrolase family protein [Acidobacteria bacterium]|jgi:N-acyl-D-amino-acid deacylase|nr:amidohydrolase family protein [Acidobacteriota bacterium]